MTYFPYTSLILVQFTCTWVSDISKEVDLFKKKEKNKNFIFRCFDLQTQLGQIKKYVPTFSLRP